MTRRMSVSLTVDACRRRVKTETRRDPGTWASLKAGDRLTLIEKGMGLRKGARQVVVAEVEVTAVEVEPIGMVDADAVEREGFDDMTPMEFIDFWLSSHGYPTRVAVAGAPARPNLTQMCRRIEWRYLDDLQCTDCTPPKSFTSTINLNGHRRWAHPTPLGAR